MAKTGKSQKEGVATTNLVVLRKKALREMDPVVTEVGTQVVVVVGADLDGFRKDGKVVANVNGALLSVVTQGEVEEYEEATKLRFKLQEGVKTLQEELGEDEWVYATGVALGVPFAVVQVGDNDLAQRAYQFTWDGKYKEADVETFLPEPEVEES